MHIMALQIIFIQLQTKQSIQDNIICYLIMHDTPISIPLFLQFLCLRRRRLLGCCLRLGRRRVGRGLLGRGLRFFRKRVLHALHGFGLVERDAKGRLSNKVLHGQLPGRVVVVDLLQNRPQLVDVGVIAVEGVVWIASMSGSGNL